MSEDGSRLSSNWQYWSHLAGLENATVIHAPGSPDFQFRANDYMFHLHLSDGWWAVDTLDDRNQRHVNTATFTTFDLAEKYLIWQWASAARSAQRLPRLGPKLYSRGMANNVEVTQLSEGIYILSVPTGQAILMDPSATIFSHLMLERFEDIEQFVKTGLEAGY